MSHCRASSFNDHLDHCFVVFETLQQSFLVRRMIVWKNKINIVQIIDHSMRLLSFLNCVRCWTNFTQFGHKSPRALSLWFMFPRTATIQIPYIKCGWYHPTSILHLKKWFPILLSCVKLNFVSYTSNYWNKCETSKNAQCSTWCLFWILKISCKIGVLKQSQSALYRNTVCIHLCNEIIVCHILRSILWSIVQICSLTIENLVFQFVPNTSILEQLESILLTILPRISILLLWNDSHQCMGVDTM